MNILDIIVPFREAGFALHWLKPRSKAPIGDAWSVAPVASLDQLRRTYAAGNNLGVRLGEPSLTADGYLHVLDLDIRVADIADEAWAALARLLPGVRREDLPEVVSGSGGESRHLYFFSPKPFRSKLLWTSDGKHRGADGKWHYDAEIELFGTGKQVACPPSIHPITGQAYRWAREFDFGGFEQPIIDASLIESLGARNAETYEFESRDPLEFRPGQLEGDLDLIPVSDLHYDDWIRLGQALHHQFGGSQEGFDLWVHHTKRSAKFTGDSQIREMRRIKWRSFGKYRGTPVTMGTVRAWAQTERQADLMAQLDDLPDDDLEPEKSDFDDLITTTAVLSDEEALGKDLELDWKSLLAITEKGDIAANLHNLRLIVENDRRTTGVMAFNEFTQEVVQRGIPGVRSPKRKNQAKPYVQLTGPTWKFRDLANGDFWTEDKDNSIRAMIEAPKTQGGYGIKVPDRDLRAAIDIVGRKNCFHPVREFLTAQVWDGKPRVERLFIDYLGAPDDAYTRDVGRLMMTAAVARVFEPGCKFDFAVILQGLQGKRKSTFISVLAKSWFAELEGDMEDPRQMVEAMQGSWILEIPELGGFVRADVRHVKAFISRRSDKVRLAYAKRAQEYHRQCIFIGSTNDDKYLKDDTGNRRFWPIICTVDSIDTDRLGAEIDQLWAEALALYQAMRVAKPRGTLPLYLTDAQSQLIAARLQESARVESADDAMAGQIAAWLDMPVTSGSVDDDLDADGQPVMRNETCLIEIWVDCMKKDRGLYNQQTAQTLGRAMSRIPEWAADGRFFTFNGYGRQRVYDRGGAKGRVYRQFAAEQKTG